MISKSLVLRRLCRGWAGLDAQVAEQGGHVGRRIARRPEQRTARQAAAMIPAGQPWPLPVGPRPRPGDTTATCLEHLARANHLPVPYLRRYLSASPAWAGAPALDGLAAVTGRTVTALQHALADLSCGHCGTRFPGRSTPPDRPLVLPHLRCEGIPPAPARQTRTPRPRRNAPYNHAANAAR